ncbi:MAG TPA: thiamine-phosphate kinase [Casimicrobiaceae bacterium]|nr:thiamine-phosphate kinase [Casimicrobiaceae bacterium]
MSEFALIERYFRRPSDDAAVVLGVGDDAALARVAEGHELVLAVDMMVESRHFLPDVDPSSLGHKILAVNLSDLAAMGATPRWALLAGALPDADPTWLSAFSQGLFALAQRHGVTLIGGDTTRGPRNVCLTIAGEVPYGQAILRSGAQAGDDIWVSGALGEAMLGFAALQGRTSLPAIEFEAARRRLERPEPRNALGVMLRGIATAMLDVSDGLVGDLGHLVEASNVGATIDVRQVPVSAALARKIEGEERELALACALAGGDDYELCFTAPVERREGVLAVGRESGVRVSRIGHIVDDPKRVVVRGAHGTIIDVPRSFDHFA